MMVRQKQFVGNLPTNCLSVFDHFMILKIESGQVLQTGTGYYKARQQLFKSGAVITK